jgi:inhibitor of KinA
MKAAYHIYALSEKALTIELGNHISIDTHYKVLSLQHFLQQLYIPGFIEVVPAYCTVTVYYDPLQVISKVEESSKDISSWMKHYLLTQLHNWQPHQPEAINKTITEIPVCYDDEYGLDLDEMANYHQTTKEEIIRIHSGGEYHVFMMGFSPGFPYMGILPDSIATPRKSQPRVKVPAGSVGIAGNQTGIYPSESPGGWNIIGRTPSKLFDKENSQPFLLSTGDTIKFISITKKQFEALL